MSEEEDQKIMDSNIKGTRFVLAVQDLNTSVSYYKHQLGLETWWEGAGWHFLKRGPFFVMLGECKDAIPPADLGDHQYYGYIEVRDIDELYEEYKEKDVDIIVHITDREWGTREFAIRTIDGHRLMFGMPL